VRLMALTLKKTPAQGLIGMGFAPANQGPGIP
jgi:hypothetical protein